MELQEKLPNFWYYNKNDFHCSSQSLRVSPEAPFNWKKVPTSQVGGSTPAPPTPPVIMVVLLYTEEADRDTVLPIFPPRIDPIYLRCLPSKMHNFIDRCSVSNYL